ncbi:hypothetical protein FZC66_06595 [Priestia megaterium]|nr:hypothetical protein FZC66_06595 [Priestia megaterium]
MMKRLLPYFGQLLFLIFGGQFLIRYVRDGDFYIAEFSFGIIGLLMVSADAIIQRVKKKRIE